MEGQRSPFGELVRKHRRQRGLTQLDLATLASNQSAPDLGGATVSERTVIALERRTTSAAGWTTPRPSTVRALAGALGLERDQTAYGEFIRAAEAPPPPRSARGPKRPPDRSASQSQPQRLFVPDGREPHLQRVQEAIGNAVSGRSGVIFVSADPGVGKTTLIQRAVHDALERHPDLVALWGDCTGRSGASDPHQPFRQALGMMIGDLSAAGPEQSISAENQRRIGGRVELAITSLLDDGGGLVDRFVPAAAIEAQCHAGALDPAVAASLVEQVRSLTGGRASAIGPNEHYFRILARYAAAGPVVLVLEDLHWADVGTASLLFHLMRRLREQTLPILVIGSFRPGELEPAHPGDRHPLPAVLRESPRLFDDALLDLSTAVGGTAGRAFVEAIVSQSVDRAPPSLPRSLFEQTAGWPLFVVGMMRWYQAAGILQEEMTGRHSWRWSPELGNLPTEIDAVFADLVGRLPHDLQALLDAASVQGATFSAEVTMQALGLSRPVLIDLLDAQLTRRFKVIAGGGVATIAGQPSHEYTFAHALLRDYIYHRMTDLERAHYHAATAEAMIALYGSGQHNGAGRIAFHFDRAGDQVEAAHAYLRAGDYHMDHQEYAQARRFFERIGDFALRLRDPFSVAQAIVGLGNCARGEGQNDLAARHFARADEIAMAEGLRLVHANSLTSMGMLDFDAGRMRQGTERLGAAIEILVELGEQDEACRSLALLSHTLHGMGNYDEAAEAARRAIDLANALGNEMFLVSGMIALANCWIDLGRQAEAIAIYEKGIVICQEYGNLHREAVCWINIALSEHERGNLDGAAAALAPVFAMGNRINGRLVGAAEFNAGVIASERGDHVSADLHYQASYDLRLAFDQDTLMIDSVAGLLRGALAVRDTMRVRSLLTEIRDMMRTQGLDGVEHTGRLFVTLVQAYTFLEDPECARLYLAQGLAFIDDRAARLADPAHRASYRNAVPAHRALRAMAAENGLTAR